MWRHKAARPLPACSRHPKSHSAERYDRTKTDAPLTGVVEQMDDQAGTRTSEDDLELWLIEPDASGQPVDVAPVSLINDATPGVYAVPAGLDPSSHYIVDISIEPRDGDAAHSGQSILRGPLEPS